MLKRPIALVLCCAAVSTPLALAGAEGTTTPLPTVCAPVSASKGLLRHAWSHSHWKDRRPVSDSQRAELATNHACLNDKDADDLKDYAQDRKAGFFLYRSYRRITPFKCLKGDYGWYAIPCYIVECESHFSWSARNPSGADGPYQILSDPVPMPANTRRLQLVHHRVAHRYWSDLGSAPWVCA